MAGRPRRSAPAKGPQIIGVALDIFALHGYRATSMDMIAAEAGMSKQTLYRYFSNKEQLFAHVVDALIARSPIRIAPLPAEDGGELRRSLIEFGNQLAETFSDAKTVQG